jgi:hypothetical protein
MYQDDLTTTGRLGDLEVLLCYSTAVHEYGEPPEATFHGIMILGEDIDKACFAKTLVEGWEREVCEHVAKEYREACEAAEMDLAEERALFRGAAL